jgi:hypothetical protein
VLYFGSGLSDTSLRTCASLLSDIMSENLFDTLRTKEQLGYSVYCDYVELFGMLTFYVRVQVIGNRAFVGELCFRSALRWKFVGDSAVDGWHGLWRNCHASVCNHLGCFPVREFWRKFACHAEKRGSCQSLTPVSVVVAHSVRLPNIDVAMPFVKGGSLRWSLFPNCRRCLRCSHELPL